MKKLFVLVFLIITSCSVDDEVQKKQTTPTTLVGYVSDVERGIDIKDFKIVLARVWDDTSVVQYVLGIEIIDSVRTDSNGNYSIAFDFIHGERYARVKQYYGSPYYTEIINPTEIRKGVENVIDIDAWYPTILKLELNVTNNYNPHLRLKNKIINHDYFHFATADIYETNIDTIVYQKTRPNSDVELMFYYSTGYSNGNTHRYFENITTTLQDTISLSYNIDCSTF